MSELTTTKPPGWRNPPNTQPSDPIAGQPRNPKPPKPFPVFPGAGWYCA